MSTECQKNICWNTTPNFKQGIFTLYLNIENITGETVYGKGKSRKKEAIVSVFSYLEKASQLESFKCINEGVILSSCPTKEHFIRKLLELGQRAFSYYSMYPQTLVTDLWSIPAGVSKGSPLNKRLHSRILDRSGKRFTGKVISAREQTLDIVQNTRGLLAEGCVIAFLNSSFRCPECQELGQIGWCDGISNTCVDAFRDGVCMNCRKSNINTLFEIKTRWEKVAEKEKYTTHAGSYVALNTLMTIHANVYLVLASRDSGNLRIGKITSSTMRENHNWQYALQEGLEWGSPSSYVTCEKGLKLYPVKMIPIVLTITDLLFKEIIESVVEKLKLIM